MELILQLISSHEVSTQEMLRDLLEEHGYYVTQATISRDIRQLKLRKKRTASGRNCYAKAPAVPAAPNGLLMDVIVKIDYAMNTVVVTCHAGPHRQPVQSSTGCSCRRSSVRLPVTTRSSF